MILSKTRLICMWWIFCEWANIGDFTTDIAPVPILLLYKRHVHHGVVNSTDTHSYEEAPSRALSFVTDTVPASLTGCNLFWYHIASAKTRVYRQNLLLGRWKLNKHLVRCTNLCYNKNYRMAWVQKSCPCLMPASLRKRVILMMPPNASRVARLSIRASAARPYKREVVAVIHRSDIAALNQSINQLSQKSAKMNKSGLLAWAPPPNVLWAATAEIQS